MAKFPVFAYGDYSKIQAAIERGSLTYPTYVFTTDEEHKNHLAFIDKDGIIQEVVGNNKNQVIRVEDLPETGDLSTLYIYNNIVYTFDGEDFIPIGKDESARLDDLEVFTADLQQQIESLIQWKEL